MSAPTKAEQLEEFVTSLGMTKKELAEFCLIELLDLQGEDEAAEYIQSTLYNPSWFVEHLFLHQAWDAPSTIAWLADVMKEAADHHQEFDT